MKLVTSLAVSAILLAGASSQALADRYPDAAERQKLEAALTAAGYSSWGKIELDRGIWEVEDARHSDGKKYDVDLDEKTLKIMKRELD
jgi:hypothetical protein